jgi:hypothetical protein
MKSKKLTESELTKVQSVLNEFNQLKMQLGDAELSKVAILKKVDTLKEDYVSIEKELSEKYGPDSQIDLQTGNIVDKEKIK